MAQCDEPPDPLTARKQLTDYLDRRARGETINGELSFYGSAVINDMREKMDKLSQHGEYARALESLATECYRGASGIKEIDIVLDAFITELTFELPQKRAKELKRGMDLVNKALG